MALAKYQDQLDEALAEFQNKLTPDENARFKAFRSTPDASSVMSLTAQLDQAAVKRSGRCIASRLSGILASIQQFSGVVGTFVSSHPTVAALVWGSMEFMLRLANNSFAYFDKLSTFLMSVDKYCPRYVEYQSLYRDAPTLQASIRNYYAEIVRCCTHVCAVLRKPDWLNLVRSAWAPFETEFGPFEARLKMLNRDVKEEIRLATAKAIVGEHQAQESHRTSVMKFWRRTDAALSNMQDRSLREREHIDFTRREILLDKLSSYNQRTAYQQARLKCHDGTAEWLMKQPEFMKWVSLNESSTFWLHGKLGCGKTVLLSSVIAHLFSQPNLQSTQKAYFFCRFDEESSLSASAILRSILRQHLQADHITAEVESAIKDLLNISLVPAKAVANVLARTVLKSDPMLFVVIDGVDECNTAERLSLLDALNSLLAASPGTIKLMISYRSRPTKRLSCTNLFEVPFNEPALAVDIATYVTNVLEAKRQNEELIIGDPTLAAHIQTTLLEGAKGMFLWVALQMDEICHQICDEDIRKTINDLPLTLEDTYRRMLSRIDVRKTDIAKRIFQWVAVAKRPLSLSELQEALSIEKYAPYSNPDRTIHDISRIIQWCEGFLVLSEINDEVVFAHPTVKRALTCSDHSCVKFNMRDADKEAGEICTTYLDFNDFKTELIKRNRTQDMKVENILEASVVTALGRKVGTPLLRLSKTLPSSRRTTKDFDISKQLLGTESTSLMMTADLRLQKHPFLTYASEHWLSHSTEFTKEDRIWHAWCGLILDEGGVARKPWILNHSPQSELNRLSRFDEEKCLRAYIVQDDHVALFNMMFPRRNPFTHTFTDSELRTMAQQATDLGKFNIFSVVWRELGSSPADMAMALTEGAGGGHMEFVESLLAANEDTVAISAVISAVHNFRTPLQAAVEGGHWDIMKMLLSAGADPNAGVSKYSPPLLTAVHGGHCTMVDRLIAAGADPNINASNARMTPLQVAVKGGQSEIVQSLLAGGALADAVAPAGNADSALLSAAKNGFVDIVRLLIDYGANVNDDTGNSITTPLQAAMEEGHLELAQVLLGAGARFSVPPATSPASRSWSQTEAYIRSFETMALLLNSIAKESVSAIEDYSSAIKDYSSAIGPTESNGHADVVRALEDAGARTVGD